MTDIGYITDTQLLAVLDLAAKGHAKQVRLHIGDPYIVHPIAVAKLVSTVPHTMVMLAAAFAHDLLEDTTVAYDEIAAVSPDVAVMVDELTEPKLAGNRQYRKAQECARLALVSNDAKTVKLADRIDNIKDIAVYDAKFANVYMRETKELLQALRGGDETLWTAASNLVRAYYEE